MLRTLQQLLGRITITGRLRLIAVIATASILAQSFAGLRALERGRMEERRAKLRAAVETVHGVLAGYGAAAEAGRLSREDAQRQALEAVRLLRYEGREYYWINDLAPRMIMHPTKPEMDGSDLSTYADPRGVRLFVEMVKVTGAAAEGGFVAYSWPKPGMSEPVRKLSFVKLYQPWGWIVGSGVYLDDVEATMAMEQRRAGTVVALNAVGLGIAAWLVAWSTRRSLRKLRGQACALEAAVRQGRLTERADPDVLGAEFRVVAEAMNETMNAFQHRMSLTTDYVSRIAEGDIPEPISEEMQGDFAHLKQSFNACIEAVNRLVADAGTLTEAARAGRLEVRADASRHQGDFRRIIEGVNGTLDAALSPIVEATRVLDELAQRDLRVRVTGAYHGDHARIKDSLNATAEALHASLLQVASAVDQVSTAAGQIASASASVASGASAQAQAIEETGASLDGMATLTHKAAESAAHADALVNTAKGAAVEGTRAMEQMAAAMVRIKASAQGTSEIIKVINEIAFQTNLLALNAAVEAARAGDAGRGFAVVADEVRSLALRSKEAARQTEELIRQSVREASEGAVTSKHVSDKLGQIAAVVTEVTEIVTEIAGSARRQSAGIRELQGAVSQIDSVTQQNAANSEESSASATELANQAGSLAAVVGAFRLEEARSRPRPRPQPASPSARRSQDTVCRTLSRDSW
jgi:methyl-accepting chemotaxis protein